MDIVEDCIKWNAARYECKYDRSLAVNLLLEETTELFEASKLVDKLDAIGDITFVAIGVFWKLGITEEIIKGLFERLDQISAEQAFYFTLEIRNLYYESTKHIDDYKMADLFAGFDLACYSLFITAIGTLRGLGMQEHFYSICKAICDSNNTKIIRGKVEAHIKANIDKGENFIPPTKQLKHIIAVHKS